MSKPVRVGFGRNVTSKRVTSWMLKGLDDLKRRLERHPSTPTGGSYICASAMRNGERGKHNARLANVLLLDLDKLTASSLQGVRRALREMQVDALMWETRHSTKVAPRVRLVVRLNRRMGRDSYKRAHAAFVSDLAARVPAKLEVDGSSSRPEQPQFTPLRNTRIFRFAGIAYRPTTHRLDRSGNVRTLDLSESTHRNVDLTSLAGTLRNRGLNQVQLEAALSAVSLTLPRPLPEIEVRTIARSIASKPASHSSLSRIHLRSAYEVVSRPVVAQWLLKPYLEENVIAVLTGDYGTYKSFLALDWSLHIASGTRWHNDPRPKTQPRPVVFISSEGRGLSVRIRAWLNHHVPTEGQAAKLRSLKFHAIEASVDLSSEMAVVELCAQIDALSEIPALIVVDTLARNSTGAEESNSEMQLFLNRINGALRERYGCTVLLIHHVGHAAKDRPRGPSSLVANTDAAFMVERLDEWNVRLRTMRLKDADVPPHVDLEARQIELDTFDYDGAAETSLVLVSGSSSFAAESEPRGVNQRAVLRVLQSERDRTGSAEWTGHELRALAASAVNGQHSRAREAREGLRKAGWLAWSNGKYRLVR
jgi:hypothetical protein